MMTTAEGDPTLTRGTASSTEQLDEGRRTTMPALPTKRLQALAGVLYSTAGFILLMGILTAEMKYPVWRHYSTRQEISDLGGTDPPHSVITQPSATIFDVTMMVAGVLILVATYFAWRHYQHKVLLVVSGLFGLGALLVGIFPGNTGPHPYVAMLAFVFSGVAAVTAAKVTTAPFRWMSLAVGVISLAALVIGELGENSVIAKSIGLGGVERWMLFPVILWLPFFGGYLLAASSRQAPAVSEPEPLRELQRV
jgi:hypothetical membrane protein